MGKGSRTKGQRGEREAIKFLKEHPDLGHEYVANRGIHYCHAQDGADLLPVEPGLPAIQVKNHKDFNALRLLAGPREEVLSEFEAGIVRMVKAPRQGWVLWGMEWDLDALHNVECAFRRDQDSTAVVFLGFKTRASRDRPPSPKADRPAASGRIGKPSSLHLC